MSRIGQLVLAAWVFCITEFVRGDALDQWNLRASGITLTLNSVAYGTNKFVAVGQTGTIIVSTNNGVSWDGMASGVTNTLNGIAWAQNLFVAVGGEGTILTSADALSWTQQNCPVINPLRCVRFVGGRFIATGAAGKLLSSIDGVNWSSLTTGETFYRLEGAAFGNGIFCVVGGTLPGGSVSLTSADGITWSKHYLGFQYLHDVAFGNGLFIATGASGQIVASTNGINWTSVELVPRDEFYGITFAQGTFVVAGGNSQGNWRRIVTSSDGVSWKDRVAITISSDIGNLQSVAYGNGYLVTIGTLGRILQSGSIFRLIPGNILSGERQLTLVGEAGRSYRLQSQENFGQTNWTDLTNFVSTSETTLIIDPAPGPNEKFYRAASP